MILIEGNAAAAIGCMMAGVTFVGWYPITPSSSLCESLIDYLKKYRKDPETGKATYAVIQAEDEIAALGMVIGAGWMGARAMTSTAGPGISLMARVHRPRLLRRSAGGDLRRPARGAVDRPADAHRPAGHLCRPRSCRMATRSIRCCFPRRSTECYTMAQDAFDLAERLQTPVFVMTRSRPRHEHLDVEAIRLPDQAVRPRQAARRREAEAAR